MYFLLEAKRHHDFSILNCLFCLTFFFYSFHILALPTVSTLFWQTSCHSVELAVSLSATFLLACCLFFIEFVLFEIASIPPFPFPRFLHFLFNMYRALIKSTIGLEYQPILAYLVHIQCSVSHCLRMLHN